MSDTSVQALKSFDATPQGKLLRMLRSMLRRYPQGRLERTQDGFGVSLGAGRWMRIRLSGEWTDADIRDSLVLFATWVVADPHYLRAGGTALSGYFVGDRTPSGQ